MTNQAKEMGKAAIQYTTSLAAAKMVSLNINWFKEFNGAQSQTTKEDIVSNQQEFLETLMQYHVNSLSETTKEIMSMVSLPIENAQKERLLLETQTRQNRRDISDNKLNIEDLKNNFNDL